MPGSGLPGRYPGRVHSHAGSGFGRTVPSDVALTQIVRLKRGGLPIVEAFT
ncbi:MAG: hypothetical protein AAGA28_01600 [Pseudomonadota bacterium]